jgi:competence protein ComEC
MSKSKIFIGIAISFAVGILIASTFNIPAFDTDIFLGVCAAAFAIFFFGQNTKCAIAALFLFCAGLGVLRLGASMVPGEYQNLLGSKQQLEGYVTEDVDVRSNEQLITFTPNGFNQNILITQSLTQSVFYGDWVVVQGTPEMPKNSGDFDYEKYLERFNVYAVMGYPKIMILKSHRLNPVKEFLLSMKDAFSGQITQVLNEPQDGLLLAILTGKKGVLPQSVVNEFSETGASHILAVDGYKVTIIVTLLAALAFYLGRRAVFWLTIFAVTAFVIITGAPSSVLRAAIMGFLLLIALNIGRQYSIVPALFFAALIMLVVNPKILFWDVGFQLSFAATLGIVYFLPLFNELTPKIPEKFGVKKLFLITLAAVISTLPIILLDFGVLSLSAPVVNVLIMPVLPLAMLFGFLSALPFLGPGFAVVANWLLLYILKITSFFAGLPYSYLNVRIFAWIFWALAAAIFGLYFFLKYLAKRKSSTVELNEPL